MIRNKLSGLAVLLLGLLLLASCGSQGNPALASTASRLDTIFAPKPGLLTIRYLSLEGKEVMGDSIVIGSPDGKTMLIDAGLPDAGTQVLAYLKMLNIDKLDIALNTHPHSDHIGGFASVASLIGIGRFYMENLPYPESKPYANAMAALERKHVPISFLKKGDTFTLGSDVSFEVLNPPADPSMVDPSDLPQVNSSAIVLRMKYGRQTFLFTADIYKDRETELAGSLGDRAAADFMHVPHHGSTTSSGGAFIRAVSPKVAVISNNHPKNFDLLRLYDAQKTKIYLTGIHGNILITSDGDKMNVITEKDWQARPDFLKNQ